MDCNHGMFGECLEQRILFSGDPVEVTLGGAMDDEVVVNEDYG